MKTILVNLRRIFNYTDDAVVYIDRRNKLLGNPYRITATCTREQSIQKFKEDFDIRIKEDKEFQQAVEALRGQILACWCTPLPCHGDIYIEYLKKPR